MMLTVPMHWNRTQGQMMMAFRLSTTQSQCPSRVVGTERSGHSLRLCNFNKIASLQIREYFYERRLQDVTTKMPASQFCYRVMGFQVNCYFPVWCFTLNPMLHSGLASGLLARKEVVCLGWNWALLPTQNLGQQSWQVSGFSTQSSLPVLLFPPLSLS